MFMSSLFAGSAVLSIDPDQEREPPAAPTPLTFPDYGLVSRRCATSASPPSPARVQSLFCALRRPFDLSDEHLHALGVRVDADCAPQDLVPRAPDGSSYLLPLTLEDPAYVDGGSSSSSADSAVKHKRNEFEQRMAELRIDNDTAYRIIAHTTKPGSRPPRLAYLRKFWEGLNNMSQYWDASMDEYYERSPVSDPSNKAEGEKVAKRQRRASDHASKPSDRAPEASASSPGDDILSEASLTPLPSDHRSPDQSNTPTFRYKGRRTANGRAMPEQLRVDTVQSFVEAAVWPFRCQVASPRQPPVVQLGRVNLPVRQTAAVYRAPSDRRKARAGILIGPVLCLQIRPDTDFPSDPSRSRVSARLDLLRELGGLLHCAQERARHGKQEVRPGQGKWWSEKPRWGGAPPSSSGSSQDKGETDVLRMAEEMLASGRPRLRRPRTPSHTSPPQAAGPRLGPAAWDPRTEYRAIGRTSNSTEDEVFMFASLNHHVALVRAEFHANFLERLRGLDEEREWTGKEEWYGVKIKRSKWFDLFDVEERARAFQALWGAIAYLMRNEEGGER